MFLLAGRGVLYCGGDVNEMARGRGMWRKCDGEMAMA